MWVLSGGKEGTGRPGVPCSGHWLKPLLLVFGENSWRSRWMCFLSASHQRESSSCLCDRQFYQSVKLLKHKTQGNAVCLQPKRAKKHKPHWVTASPPPFPLFLHVVLHASVYPSPPISPPSVAVWWLQLCLFCAAEQFEVQQICIIPAWSHKAFKEARSEWGICAVIVPTASEWLCVSIPLGVCLCIKI